MKSFAPALAICLAVSLVLAVVWILVANFLVAPTIAKAYQGESFSLVNRVITGQSRHDLDHYLAKWDAISYLVVIAIFASGFAFYLAGICGSERRIPLLDGLANRGPMSVEQAISVFLSILATAVLFGFTCSLLAVQLVADPYINIVTYERGFFQRGTFAILTLGTAFAAATALRRSTLFKNFLLVAFLMLLYTAREVDLPFMLRLGRPTDKWKPFFLGPESGTAKAGFALLILATGLAIIVLIWRQSIFRALAQREAWAIYGLAWSIMLASSQLLIDKSSVGVELKYRAFEEPFEMLTAAVCFLSVYSLAYRGSAGSDES